MTETTHWLHLAQQSVVRLATALGPRGQWPGWVVADAAPASGRRDMAAPLTALGVLALRDLPLTGVAELVQRSCEHIALTVQPGGLWRYYANIPPDTDDTAMCALALGLAHPLVREHTERSLAATRLADGRFPTWFEPGWAPAVDAIPNAHVVAVLGECDTTQVAIAWLIDVVARQQEVASSLYYPDPLDLHLALTRALQHGVTSLRPALELAAARACQRLQNEALTPYRTAQAMLVANTLTIADTALLARAARRLASCCEAPGQWPAETLYVAGNTELGGLWHYQSWAIVSALCARALAVAADIQRS